MTVRRFTKQGEQHIAVHTKPLGSRASIVQDDGRFWDTIHRYATPRSALGALHKELTAAHAKRIALIDAALAELAYENREAAIARIQALSASLGIGAGVSK